MNYTGASLQELESIIYILSRNGFVDSYRLSDSTINEGQCYSISTKGRLEAENYLKNHIIQSDVAFANIKLSPMQFDKEKGYVPMPSNANSSHNSENSKGIKEFVYEMLTLLDEKAETTDVTDFIEDFCRKNHIERSRIKFKIDELVNDEYIRCVGHEFLSLSGKSSFVAYQNILASITPKGENKLEILNKKSNYNQKGRNAPELISTNAVFIVHGHDKQAKTEVARFIEKLGLEAIILHEQINSGKTIIEKIEEYTNVGFGIVLYTPCDLGKQQNSDSLRGRARQNVVFEHGYLMAKIGRQKVCALVKGEVETPNDISGIVYIEMDDKDSWHLPLAKELNKSGYEIDLNKLLTQR